MPTREVAFPFEPFFGIYMWHTHHDAMPEILDPDTLPWEVWFSVGPGGLAARLVMVLNVGKPIRVLACPINRGSAEFTAQPGEFILHDWRRIWLVKTIEDLTSDFIPATNL